MRAQQADRFARAVEFDERQAQLAQEQRDVGQRHDRQARRKLAAPGGAQTTPSRRPAARRLRPRTGERARTSASERVREPAVATRTRPPNRRRTTAAASSPLFCSSLVRAPASMQRRNASQSRRNAAHTAVDDDTGSVSAHRAGRPHRAGRRRLTGHSGELREGAGRRTNKKALTFSRNDGGAQSPASVERGAPPTAARSSSRRPARGDRSDDSRRPAGRPNSRARASPAASTDALDQTAHTRDAWPA